MVLRCVEPTTLEVVQRLMARFGARDAGGVARLFAERVQWRAPRMPGPPWDMEVHTRREVEAYFLGLFATFDFEAVMVDRVLIDGEDAVVLGGGRYAVADTGQEFTQDFAVALSTKDGVIYEYRLFEDTLARAVALEQVTVRSAS